MELEPADLLFFAWNLILLAVPLVLGWFMVRFCDRTGCRRWPERIAAAGLFLLWVFFLPNAPYVIADVRHLTSPCFLNADRICAAEAWSIPLLFCYALTGWVAYVYAVRQMRELFARLFSPLAARWFVPLLTPLVALGLLLGLIDRLNSWDMLLRPGTVFTTALSYAQDGERLSAYLAYLGSLYILFYFGDRLFRPLGVRS